MIFRIKDVFCKRLAPDFANSTFFAVATFTGKSTQGIFQCGDVFSADNCWSVVFYGVWGMRQQFGSRNLYLRKSII